MTDEAPNLRVVKAGNIASVVFKRLDGSDYVFAMSRAEWQAVTAELQEWLDREEGAQP